MRLILISAIFLSLILSSRFYLYFKDPPQYNQGDKVRLETTLLNEPKINRSSQTFQVSGITIYAPRFPRYSYGDSLIIEGKVVGKTYISKQNSRVINQKIMNYPRIQKQENSRILAVIQVIRQKIKVTFNSALNSMESGLLLGIVFGFKDGIDNDFYSKLRDTGVLHVVTASGTNVSIFSAFILSLTMLFLRRRIALLVSIFAVVFYAFLSGLEPSIIRASLMSVFSYSALALGRQGHSLLVLSLVAFLMLLFDPPLIGNIGFQLSFLSTLGILLVKPLLDSLFKNRFPLFDDLSTTLSAQAGSLPVLLGTFSSYSLISILVNALVLWTIPILMILGGLAALAGFIHPFISAVFLYLAYPFLLFFEAVVDIGSSLSIVLKIQSLSPFLVIGYYLVILSLVLVKRKK